jgi:retron-type reverse transcriptase
MTTTRTALQTKSLRYVAQWANGAETREWARLLLTVPVSQREAVFAKATEIAQANGRHYATSADIAAAL